MMQKTMTSFIVPMTARHLPKICTVGRKAVKLSASLHPLYDVAAVSTYIAYFTAQYWKGEPRRDVEFFAIALGFLWNFTTDHDPTIFLYLWLVGGLSHFAMTGFLQGGNEKEAVRFYTGVQLGGYMSFLLVVVDLLDVVMGF